MLGQVHAHAADGQGAQVLAVHRALDFEHRAGGIGQQAEIAHGSHGPHQLGHHGPCGLDQRLMALLRMAQRMRSHGLELHLVLRAPAACHAALPGAPQPAGHALRRECVLGAGKHLGASLGDQYMALAGRWRCGAE